MAGGSGTRLWPASRAARPKQMLPLAGGKSLIAATVERLEGLCDRDHTWIVTNPGQVDGVRELVGELPEDHVIVEPEARDTAPCIALATATIAAREPDATMLVMPADHLIEPRPTFHRMVQRAAEIAADHETLVTFGVQPTRPATGFGYIECGDAHDAASPAAYRAVRFREKPDAATAARFVDSGSFLWNSGIFVWTTRALLGAMRATEPDLASCTDRMTEAIASDPAALNDVFRTAPRTSIDYAVMERAPRVVVIRAEFDWNDIGGLGALATVGVGDDNANHALLTAGARQLAFESHDNLVYAEGDRTVCLFGVEDLVVVDSGNAILVCPRDRADELKRFLEHARDQGRQDLL